MATTAKLEKLDALEEDDEFEEFDDGTLALPCSFLPPC